MSNEVQIAAVGTSAPLCRLTQKRIKELLLENYSQLISRRSLDVMCKVLEHPGIHTRAFAFTDESELLTLKNEDPDVRMERFRIWALKLGAEAVHNALSSADIPPDSIDALIVNTCTGYLCPGLSTYFLEKMGMTNKILAYDLVGAGCGGALPNMQLASALAAQGKTVLSIAVEICSATFQMGDNLSLIISNSIFGDGAAAAIIWNKGRGITIKNSSSTHLPQYREDVRYVYKKGKLHNQISNKLSGIIDKNVPEMIRTFIRKNNCRTDDIAHWFVHPGGDRILRSIQENLGLSEVQMKYAYRVMHDYGNISSPTVLFELHDFLKEKRAKKGELGIITAFGAGLSIHNTLLEW